MRLVGADTLARSRRWLRHGQAAEEGTAREVSPTAQRSVGCWLVDQCGVLRSASEDADAGTTPPGARMRRMVLDGIHATGRPRAGPFPAADPWELLRPDPEALLTLAAHVAGTTALGTRPGDTTAATERWTTAVRAGLAAACRLRDLEVMAALVRACAFLHRGGDSALSTAARELTAQQRPDGGFGGQPNDGAGAAADDIRLPLTLTCTWALAELVRPGLTAAAYRSDPPHGGEPTQPG